MSGRDEVVWSIILRSMSRVLVRLHYEDAGLTASEAQAEVGALPAECFECVEREIESRITIPDFTRGEERGQ